MVMRDVIDLDVYQFKSLLIHSLRYSTPLFVSIDTTTMTTPNSEYTYTKCFLVLSLYLRFPFSGGLLRANSATNYTKHLCWRFARKYTRRHIIGPATGRHLQISTESVCKHQTCLLCPPIRDELPGPTVAKRAQKNVWNNGRERDTDACVCVVYDVRRATP